ncbi:hypothetical protein MLD38_020344 [Melastoma candidum]|uniref:Uncharacterized protein n=1 Tax=Melastoma candidum TaxID=119954 RepID=A0ACB9QFM8_9MYRT|nr:hypothetical protein MLD38_020344 [Melastoma candidum]
MDAGGLSGGMSSGMLGLGMQQLNSQSSHQLPQLGSYPHHEAPAVVVPQSVKPGSPFGAKSKQAFALSDDDEQGLHGDDCVDGDGKSKASLWHRMKWTDTMVRVLIMAVFYFGDDGGAWSECSNDPKKKSAGGLLQKKGKWKSVSQAMMEKGFYVSPQQCEDKFNDLNKRYKRVNDILGKGTACRVVENQSLLDTMDLTPKMKDEVKKLLNSKHLFFREMCTYHSSCGHGVGGGGSSGGGGGGLGAHHSPEVAVQPHLQQKSTHQLPCSHSSELAMAPEDSGRMEPARGGSCEDEFDDDEDNDDDDTDDGQDEEEDEILDHEDGRHHTRDRGLRKRPRKATPYSHSSALTQQLSSELTRLVGDGNKSPWEKRHWMKLKLLQLEEQQVSYQLQGFELEKQRMKWVKFSSKKERDMERAKLENDRRRLENERMMLLVRQKEFELVDIQQQQQQQQQHSSNRRNNPPSV